MIPITYEKVKVLSNTALGNGIYRIRLSCNRRYGRAVPGQFVMVRSGEQIDPLLPRPFSIHRLIRNKGSVTGLDLLYKVVGKGTQLLSRLQSGDVLSMTGPLGKGFDIAPEASKVKIVAGGMGVAPMVFLAQMLSESTITRAAGGLDFTAEGRKRQGREVPQSLRVKSGAKHLDWKTQSKRNLSSIEIFIGGRTKADLLCLQDFSAIGLAVHVTTDDGSSGDQCLVTDPLDMAVTQDRPDIIFACGPMEMLTCVAGIAEKHGVCCQVSIETMMACGMGACLGCAVAARRQPHRYWHACKDGPVFDTRDLDF